MRRSRPIGQDLRHDEPLVYERLSDPILVKRAKDGDRRALAALCERHAPRVERLAHHLLRDHEDARDASQDALAKLCVKLPQFRGESSFSHLAAPARRSTPAATSRSASSRAAASRSTRTAARRATATRPGRPRRRSCGPSSARCLAEISPAQAKVVVLKHGFDFSFEEIAGAEGMPVGTAKCHAHRGRNGLRERLSA